MRAVECCCAAHQAARSAPATFTTPTRSKSPSKTSRSRSPGAAIRSRSCARAAIATFRIAHDQCRVRGRRGPARLHRADQIRGNTRTRDYVIRREFDLVEGDAYNRALVDRAERRLKNLSYFKTVKITNEPGSAPDRIIINVDVEEQSTGEFSVSGGYSTADGLLGEVSVGERNLLGRGQAARAAVQYGQRAQGLRVVFRRALSPGLPAGASAGLVRQADRIISVPRPTTPRRSAAAVRFGFALREDLVAAAALFALPAEDHLQNITCRTVTTSIRISVPFRALREPNTIPAGCLRRLARALAASTTATPTVKHRCDQELAQGPVTVAGRLRPDLQHARQQQNPTSGILAEFKQEFAGLGGDVNFIRTTGDVRFYYEVDPGLSSAAASAGAATSGWGGTELRMQRPLPGGPELVRGFRPPAFGPRDLTPWHDATTRSAARMYWAASARIPDPALLRAEGRRHSSSRSLPMPARSGVTRPTSSRLTGSKR